MLDDVGRFLLLLHTLKDFQKFRLDQLRSTGFYDKIEAKSEKEGTFKMSMSDNFWRQTKSSACIQTYTNVMRLCCGMVFGIPAVILKICSRKIMGLERKPMYTEFFEPHRCDRRLCWRLMTQNGSRKNSGGRAWQKDEMHKVRWMPNWNFSSIFIWFGIVLSSHSPSIWYLSSCIEGRLRSSAKSGIATSAVRASSCLKLRLFRMVTVILMIFFVGLSDGSCSRT